MKKSYRMSGAQKRIFALEEIQEMKNAYNVPMIFRINGLIDTQQMYAALEKLHEHNEVLRTSFIHTKELFVQQISEKVQPIYHYNEQETVDLRKEQKKFVQAFDLGEAPLMRTKVLYDKQLNISYLFMDLHHIIYDGGSYETLLTQLTRFYNGEEVLKAELQFKDFAAWQEKQNLQADETYWLTEFMDEVDSAELKTDFQRTQERNNTGNYLEIPLSDEIIRQTNDLSKKMGVSNYVIFMSAYMLLISHYSRNEEIILGTPMSGRVLAPTKDMIGMFVNTVAIKAEIENNATFNDLVQQVNKKVTGAIQHQAYPFEKLVEKIPHQKDRSRNPIFDLFFAYQVNPASTFYFDKQRLESIKYENETSKFDISTVIIEEDGKVFVEWTYMEALYKRSTIQRLAHHYQTLLADVLDNPMKKVGESSMVDANEQNLMLKEFSINSSLSSDRRLDKKGETINSMFEEIVKKCPDKIALMMGTEQLTYAQLVEKANRVAHIIQQNHKAEDFLVGVYLKPSLDTIISIFGILKSGRAYIPLDTEYPPERLRYICDDSRINTVITNNQSLSKELEELKLTVINMDQLQETKSKVIVETVSPEDLAYIIYTSGTTGNPKGVMIEHHSVVNLAKWKSKFGEYNEEAIILQNFNYIFDGSVWEIFPPLLSGNTLEIVPEECRKEPDRLLKLLPNRHITIVPTLFNSLLDYAKENDMVHLLTQMKRVYLAAEPVTKDILDKYKNICKADLSKISNCYGPTEGTVCCSANDFGENNIVGSNQIGGPIANVSIYIMRDDQLCGIGVPGELCIAGSGVARGYLNKSELTKEKFLPDPFVIDQRLYRTGDLARWDEKGNIEYLGRIDEQVKIRGFRVELSEVEEHIRRLSGVKDAVCIKSVLNQTEALVGYVIGTAEMDMEQLKKDLQQTLPDYMVPQVIMQVDYFPMTRNGKIAKRLLPEPKISLNKQIMMPRTEEEREIVAVFKSVLGVEDMGIDDSFFMLGGDSIKAIRIVSKLRELGIHFDVKTIMEQKTIINIQNALGDSEVTKIDQSEVSGVFIPTPVQQRFLQSNLEEPDHFNQAMMFEYSDKLDIDILEKMMFELLKHHDLLRTIVKEQELYIRKSEEITEQLIQINDLSHISDSKEKEQLIAEHVDQIHHEIDRTVSMVKAAVFETGTKNYLFLCVHHLVIDGISWRILLEDLNHLYEKIRKNSPVRLGQKTESYKSWSEQLKQFAGTVQAQSELPYWKAVTNRVIESKFLNSDAEGYEQGYIEASLSQEQTEQLLYQIGKAFNTSVFESITAALIRSLGQYHQKKQVSVLIEGHGREDLYERIHIDRTVGWFTSTYPIVVEHGEKSIRESFGQIKRALQGVPNKGIGYNLLTAYQEETAFAEPEVTLNYLGQFRNETLSNEDQFKISDLPVGEEFSSKNNFSTPISFNIVIINNQMDIKILFNAKKITKLEMEDLLKLFKESVLELIGYCQKELEKPQTYQELILPELELERLVASVDGSGRKIEKLISLTAMQEGILYHYLSEPQSTNYIVQSVYSNPKRFDVKVIQEVLDLLSKKYEIIRSRVACSQYSEPRLVILKQDDLLLDAYTLDENEKIEEVAQRKILQGFDLENESPFKLTIVEGQEIDQNYLIFTFHHIAMDGWCMSILLNDFTKFYGELTTGKIVKDLEEEVEQNKQASLSDIVKANESQNKTEAREYWRELLKDYDAVNHISPFYKQGEIKEERIRKVSKIDKKVPAEVNQKINQLVKGYGVTKNTIFEAVWGLVLHKFNYTNDTVFGKIVSGRDIAISGAEEMLGLFINMIPVRIRTEEGMTVAELLKKVQDQAINSSEYDKYPLAEINLLTASQENLIQTMIAFENYYKMEENASDLNLDLIDASEETHYPLSLSVYEKDGLNLSFLYKYDLYTQSEIERLSGYFMTILTKIVINPDGLIADVAHTESQRVEELLLLNNQPVPYPSELSIVELFKKQVSLYSDKVVLEDESDRFTYEEVDRISDQIASGLAEQGIKEKDIVGFISDKRAATIILMVGILKSGATYLPLDPNYPVERMNMILTDSQCKLCVVMEDEANLLAVPVINYSELIKSATQVSLPSITASTPAYLIYTSGTTGKPKGVLINQRSIIRLVINTNYCDFLNIRLLQAGSMAFDAATFEIWGALLNGGYLYVASENGLSNVEIFKAMIKNHDISTMFITTALFNSLIDLDNKAFEGLTQLYVGGEKASEQHMNKCLVETPSVKLNNIYGPTENTTFTTYYPVKDIEKFPSLPIGKPISNTQVYLFDVYGQLCDVGMPGELIIGGDGLAEGYLNRPELTEEKFITHPLIPNQILYRTGDIVRMNEMGDIEYLDRSDEQIKIRGFRIELGEIVSRLVELNEVQEAYVTVEKETGDPHLIAYLVGKETISIETVKQKLREVLPEYMIPISWIQLPNLPLNSNGKVDKLKLPKIERKLNQPDAWEARSETEKLVGTIFEEVLEVSGIGLEEDFYKLGGHSLRTMRVISKIDAVFNVTLTIKEIKELATISAVSKTIDSEKIHKEQPIMQIKPVTNETAEYLLSPAQNRMYLLSELHKESTLYNIPTALSVEGFVNTVQLEKAFVQLIERHESLRTNFYLKDGHPVQAVKDKITFKLESKKGTKEQLKDMYDDFVQPFDLAEDCLIRALFIEITGGDNILLVDIHHIISDGASTTIWIEELLSLYIGEELTPIELHYKDFAAWQNQVDLSEQEKYWLEEFSGEIPTLNIRTDYPRPNIPTNKGESFISIMPDELRNHLRAFCQEHKYTEYTVLMTAFTLLLSKYSRQDEIVVGTPFSGRNHEVTQNMLGMFVNTLPIRNQIDEKQTFIDLADRVQDKCLDAFQNHAYPLEELVNKVTVVRDISRNPLFSVMFALQNDNDIKMQTADFSMSFLEIKSKVSKFDITLSMSELSGQYHLYWEYATDLFKEETISRLSEHFLYLLGSVLNDPLGVVGTVQMLPEKEQQFLLEKNYQNYEQYSSITFLDYFREAVARFPEKNAVRFEDKVITYRELDEKSTILASQLRRKGIQLEDISALVMDKSIEMFIAMLGIIKAGGAYLPLDPKHPIDRLMFILTDSQTKFVLFNNEEGKLLSEQADENVIFINMNEMNLTASEDIFLPPVEPNQLMYVIYTSGTTGNPKGVMLEHRGVVNLIQSLNSILKVNEQSLVLQCFNYIFDGSVFEIFPSLALGATLDIVLENELTNPKIMLQKMANHFVVLTPSLFNMILDYAIESGQTEKLVEIETLCFGGEAVSIEMIDKYRSIAGSDLTKLYNCYGPSEVTVWATVQQYSEAEEYKQNSIGYPINQTSVLCMNNHLLSGIGIPGEIYIAGCGLARGYLNNSELTEQTFTFNDQLGQRVYRTGDLGYVNEKGQVIYIGRVDEQVKIRGFRIELEEIERCLKAIPTVNNAAVTVYTNENGEKTLCAYLIGSEELLDSEIKYELAKHLPGYMLPEFYQYIEQFSFGRTGKLDKKSLPAPTMKKRTGNEVLPTNETEEKIVHLFEKVLQQSIISIEDDFFAMGGNSLNASVLSYSIEKEFNKKIPLIEIFKLKTPEKIARMLNDLADVREVYEELPMNGELEEFEIF
ncbi:hypothetical protein B1B04_23970 [Lysinibacillus sp. KCTC 33748]|uniref:non-ribosomal peptide synthetase n=1 Tax=unclassified Lysinibacillus TaxID=2636778 RepID=UPI0009A74EF6|nr:MULTISPECIES: non-ribosomal peptide synthetase [unclassified Lysinibacillus]OXS66481.1 hypothetical protein B1B04_23970 [Lysinibacillus sp. KCTC 33748]SKC17519.1 non-ribosomal peptide synthase domain TIGR01720/amino acid adenylation domain-containing protein [Lysinibacillus sp. AC-3]